MLQTLGHYVLGHSEPADYGDFLRQRVETNYFAAALLLPEQHRRGAPARGQGRTEEIAVEDIRDAFAVSYETAAHRFTNLATQHLGLPVHFMRVHQSGIIYKAYENDGVRFPPTTPAPSRASRRAGTGRPGRCSTPTTGPRRTAVHRHPVRDVLVHGARRPATRRRGEFS